jgi:hypothetical protein
VDNHGHQGGHQEQGHEQLMRGGAHCEFKWGSLFGMSWSTDYGTSSPRLAFKGQFGGQFLLFARLAAQFQNAHSEKCGIK